MKKTFTTLVIAATLFACNTKNENQTEVNTIFNLDSAKSQIAAHHLAFETAIVKGDSMAIGNLFTIDAKRLIPNSSAITGRAAIISNTSTALNFIGSGKFHTLDVWGDENTITEEGTYILNKKDGSLFENGKYIAIYKKVDGKLEIFKDIWNTDVVSNPMK